MVMAKQWNGGMSVWQNGGMAEWRNGVMAEWRNGGNGGMVKVKEDIKHKGRKVDKEED